MAEHDAIVNQLSALTKNVSALVLAINTKFPDWVGVPASASAAGTAGQVAYDATHFYVCIATNSWVRVTLAAW